MKPRYVVLGLGASRSPWLANISAWSTAGAVPVEVFKCISSAEVMQRLRGLRPFSAVLLERPDDAIASAARAEGVAVILLSDHHRGAVGGIAAVLSPNCTPEELLSTLSSTAAVVADPVSIARLDALDDGDIAAGNLFTVCGSGGTGASTIAMALAQDLAGDVLNTDLVVLADFARHSEQAMLHDAQEVVPCIEELIELHRARRPSVDEIRAMAYAVPPRGYRLLLGARRSSAWASMAPTSIQASIEGLRRAYRHTVADVTADFEGESQSGSHDVEERNTLARSSVLQAEVIFVVGNPTLKGVHSACRVIGDLRALGIGLHRIQPVMNRTPKRFTASRQVREALRTLVSDDLPEPLFVREEKVEAALQDSVPLPDGLATALGDRCRSVLNRRDGRERPAPIPPGTLGFVDEAVS